jgi:hydrogenase maturation protease
MKPRLAIGLGNPLMGDEGIGWHVVGRLAADPRLPADVEAIPGGTDLLGCAGRIEGRRRVVVIDAIADDAEPGSVSIVDGDVDERQEHAHHLSVVQAVKLLGMIVPARFTVLGVSVGAVRLGEELSPELAARLPAIVDRVLEEL